MWLEELLSTCTRPKLENYDLSKILIGCWEQSVRVKKGERMCAGKRTSVCAKNVNNIFTSYFILQISCSMYFAKTYEGIDSEKE